MVPRFIVDNRRISPIRVTPRKIIYGSPKDPIYERQQRNLKKKPYAKQIGSGLKFIREQRGLKTEKAAADYWAKYDKRGSETLGNLIRGIESGHQFIILGEAHLHGKKIGKRTENLLRYEQDLVNYTQGVLGLSKIVYHDYGNMIREHIQPLFQDQKLDKKLKSYKRRR